MYIVFTFLLSRDANSGLGIPKSTPVSNREIPSHFTLVSKHYSAVNVPHFSVVMNTSVSIKVKCLFSVVSVVLF